MTLKWNGKLAFCLTWVLISMPTFAASDGAGSSAGGHAVKNELFDFAENNGSKIFNPEKLPCYKTYLEPIFEKIRTRVPDLLPVLKAGLKAKTWMIESKPLRSLDDSDSLIMVDEKIVGIQNNIDVRISKAWFENPNVSDENRAGLILHELSQNYRLSDGIKNGMTVSDVREMTRILFANPFPSAEQLQKSLSRAKYGVFLTAKEIQTWRKDYNNLEANFDKFLCAAASEPYPESDSHRTNIDMAWSMERIVLNNANDWNEAMQVSPTLSDLNYWTLNSQMLDKMEIVNALAMTGGPVPEYCNK